MTSISFCKSHLVKYIKELAISILNFEHNKIVEALSIHNTSIISKSSVQHILFKQIHIMDSYFAKIYTVKSINGQ